MDYELKKAEHYGILYKGKEYFNPHLRLFETTYKGNYYSFKPDFIGFQDGGICLFDNESNKWHFYGDGHLELNGICLDNSRYCIRYPQAIRFILIEAILMSVNGNNLIDKIVSVNDFLDGEINWSK